MSNPGDAPRGRKRATDSGSNSPRPEASTPKRKATLSGSAAPNLLLVLGKPGAEGDRRISEADRHTLERIKEHEARRRSGAPQIYTQPVRAFAPHTRGPPTFDTVHYGMSASTPTPTGPHMFNTRPNIIAAYPIPALVPNPYETAYWQSARHNTSAANSYGPNAEGTRASTHMLHHTATNLAKQDRPRDGDAFHGPRTAEAPGPTAVQDHRQKGSRVSELDPIAREAAIKVMWADKTFMAKDRQQVADEREQRKAAMEAEKAEIRERKHAEGLARKQAAKEAREVERETKKAEKEAQHKLEMDARKVRVEEARKRHKAKMASFDAIDPEEQARALSIREPAGASRVPDFGFKEEQGDGGLD